jgi:hypothetical protein
MTLALAMAVLNTALAALEHILATPKAPQHRTDPVKMMKDREQEIYHR